MSFLIFFHSINGPYCIFRTLEIVQEHRRPCLTYAIKYFDLWVSQVANNPLSFLSLSLSLLLSFLPSFLPGTVLITHDVGFTLSSYYKLVHFIVNTMTSNNGISHYLFFIRSYRLNQVNTTHARSTFMSFSHTSTEEHQEWRHPHQKGNFLWSSSIM